MFICKHYNFTAKAELFLVFMHLLEVVSPCKYQGKTFIYNVLCGLQQYTCIIRTELKTFSGTQSGKKEILFNRLQLLMIKMISLIGNEGLVFSLKYGDVYKCNATSVESVIGSITVEGNIVDQWFICLQPVYLYSCYRSNS